MKIVFKVKRTMEQMTQAFLTFQKEAKLKYQVLKLVHQSALEMVTVAVTVAITMPTLSQHWHLPTISAIIVANQGTSHVIVVNLIHPKQGMRPSPKSQRPRGSQVIPNLGIQA